MMYEEYTKDLVLAGSRAISILCQFYLNKIYPLGSVTDWDIMYLGKKPDIPNTIHGFDPTLDKEMFADEAKYFIKKYGLSEVCNGTKICIPEIMYLGLLNRAYLAENQKILEDIYKMMVLRDVLKIRGRYKAFIKKVKPKIRKLDLCVDLDDFYLNQLAYFKNKDNIFVGQCAYKLLGLHYLHKTLRIFDLSFYTTSDCEYTGKYWGGSKIKTEKVDNPTFIEVRGIKVLHPVVHYKLYQKFLDKRQLKLLDKIISYGL